MKYIIILLLCFSFLWADVVMDGSNKVTNGDFTTDSDWTKNGWTISGGTASLAGDGSFQALISSNSVVLVIGRTYSVSFEIISTNGISVKQGYQNSVGGFLSNFNTYTTIGMKTVTYTPTEASDKLWFSRETASDVINITIDNVSVMDITNSVNAKGGISLTGLEGYWSLDKSDATGTTIDDKSGNGNDGTSANSPVFTTDQNGVSNQSQTFNGSSDYIDLDTHIANFASLSDGSISVWFKTSNQGSLQRIVSSSDKTDGSSDLGMSMSTATTIEFIIREGGVIKLLFFTSVGGLSDGEWHHIVYTTDSGGNNIYVDGVVDASPNYSTGNASTNAFFSDINDLDVLRIGVNEDDGGNQFYFDGEISDVLIYTSALSSTEVSNTYQSGLNTGKFRINTP